MVGDNEVPFGVLRRGFAADIIATSGDLENDFERAVDKDSIVFVMKGGRIFKRDGKPLVKCVEATNASRWPLVPGPPVIG